MRGIDTSYGMDQQELKKLRESLVAEASALEKQLNEFTNDNPMIKGDRKAHFHAADQSDTLDEKARSVTDYDEERAVEQNLEVRLREITGTLKRIDEGAYGVCEKCISPIDVRRLKVVPTAKFCVSCTKKAVLI